MRKLVRLSLVALLFAACSQDASTPPDQILPDGTRPQGQTSFETPLGGNSRYGAGESTDNAGPPQAGVPADDKSNSSAQPRLIEESDIYKIEGNNLFILNRYRGLQIVDISNLDAPRIVGRSPMFGYPKDMYVRNGIAYVIVSDYWSYWRDESLADDSLDSFHGSQLRVIDVTNVANPHVVGAFDLEGDCGDSRIVGSVMYLVSHRYSWWTRVGTEDTVDATNIVSIDISNPANIHVVDTKSFPRNGYDHHVFVNEQAIFLASADYVGSGWNTYQTQVRYIDITDPFGAIRLRGVANAPGRVQDRWGLDVFNGVLRVASGQSWGNGDVYLTTFNVANPDAIAQLGQAVLRVNEQLKSARFDGNRGYLVSYRQVDPLFAFDLSDPAHPRQLGELQMSGWLDFMVPMGDRVVALGHEDVTAADGSRTISLAVSLIDVSSDTPVLLDREVMDGSWGWVPSSNDDFAKVFRVLPSANLIVFPFSAWDRTTWRHVGGVQLIDYFQDHLTKRGLIGNAGWVERGVPHGTDTVLTISSEVFQVMDIANRDQPRLRGRLELARNVADFALVGNGAYTAQLCGDWTLGDTTLTLTPATEPDTASPLGSVHTPAPYGRLFTNGSFAYVSSVIQNQATTTTPGSQFTRIQVIDVSNPAAPRERGHVDLPEAVWGSYGYWYWGSGDEVVQVRGNILALHHYEYPYWGGCYGAGCPTESGHRIYLVDLGNPDQPRLASTVKLTDVDWAWGLRAQGNKLLLSDYDSYERNGKWYAKYGVRQIDVTDANNPVVGRPVNIPGWLVGTNASGTTVYTMESWWDEQSQTSRSALHALLLGNGVAYLQSSVAMTGWLSTVEIEGDAGFATASVSGTDAKGQWYYRTELVTLDLSNARNLHIAGRASVPENWGWLRKVAGGRAFVTGGSGIFSFNVTDLTQPRFEKFFRTYGWVQDVVVQGNKAFLPSGYYGVQVLDLSTAP